MLLLRDAVFDVRKLPQWLILLIVFVNGLSSGVVFGWSGLAIAMRRERQFCASDVGAECGSEQSLQFTLIFNCAFIGQSLFAPLFGLVLDRFGPRVTALCGVVLYSFGLLLFAFSDMRPSSESPLNGFAAGLFFWGTSSSAIQLPLFQFANLFERRSQVTSLVVGMFILSTMVFPICNVVHGALFPRASLRGVLLVLLVQPFVVLVCTVLFVPRDTIPITFVADRARELSMQPRHATPAAAAAARIVTRQTTLRTLPSGSKLVRRRVRVVRVRLRRKSGASSPVPPPAPQRAVSRALPNARLVQLGSFRRQAVSPEALFGYVFFSVNFLPFNWYIASSADQLAALGDADGLLSSAFQFFVPAGVLAVPLNGILLDRCGIFVTGLVASLVVVGIAVLTAIPSLELQWLSFVLLAFGRPLHIVTFFAYFAKFGFKSYGRLVGIGNLMFGVANQLQFALVAMSRLGAGFLPVHVFLIVVGAVLCVGINVTTWFRF